MTETGYHTDVYADGVTVWAGGILSVNQILGGLKSGMRQTFIYEALDEDWTGYEGKKYLIF
jgi:hypothetical protein